MTGFQKYKNRAEKLVAKLKEKCTAKTICENYGQKEIRKFIDKMNKEIFESAPMGERDNLTYQEECEIKDILYKVSSITPKI